MNGMEWEVVVVVVVLVVVLVAVAAMVVQCGVGVQWTGLCAVLLPSLSPPLHCRSSPPPTLVPRSPLHSTPPLWRHTGPGRCRVGLVSAQPSLNVDRWGCRTTNPTAT